MTLATSVEERDVVVAGGRLIDERVNNPWQTPPALRSGSLALDDPRLYSTRIRTCFLLVVFTILSVVCRQLDGGGGRW